MKDGSGLPWCNACTAASAHVPCTALPANNRSIPARVQEQPSPALILPCNAVPAAAGGGQAAGRFAPQGVACLPRLRAGAQQLCLHPPAPRPATVSCTAYSACLWPHRATSLSCVSMPDTLAVIALVCSGTAAWSPATLCGLTAGVRLRAGAAERGGITPVAGGRAGSTEAGERRSQDQGNAAGQGRTPAPHVGARGAPAARMSSVWQSPIADGGQCKRSTQAS